MNWEFGIDMYTLICIKWMTNKSLLYKKKREREREGKSCFHPDGEKNQAWLLGG